MNPVLIPTMVPLAEYQRHQLTAELAALHAVGALADPLVDGARVRYGATHEEADEIRRALEGVSHGRAA